MPDNERRFKTAANETLICALSKDVIQMHEGIYDKDFSARVWDDLFNRAFDHLYLLRVHVLGAFEDKEYDSNAEEGN